MDRDFLVLLNSKDEDIGKLKEKNQKLKQENITLSDGFGLWKIRCSEMENELQAKEGEVFQLKATIQDLTLKASQYEQKMEMQCSYSAN
jgi:hypothetical protein